MAAATRKHQVTARQQPKERARSLAPLQPITARQFQPHLKSQVRPPHTSNQTTPTHQRQLAISQDVGAEIQVCPLYSRTLCRRRLTPSGGAAGRRRCGSEKLTDCPSFHQSVLIDTAPLPEDVPAVKEVGASSAPLLSASFFIGARCRDYNDDYMQCKSEKPGRGELECMKEGRRVTRCASSVYVYTPGRLESWMRSRILTMGR